MNATPSRALEQPWVAPWPPARSPVSVRAEAPRLSLPSTERSLSCAWKWWAVMLPAWLQRHHLAPQSVGRYGATFTASTALRDRYTRLFDLRQDPAGAPYPFLLAHGLTSLLQARVLSDLGVNRRHLRHLGHHTRLPAGATALAAAARQQLDCHLQRVVRVSPTEVLALLQTHICDDGDQTLAVVDDSFVVQGLAPADALLAEDNDLLRRAFSRARRRGPEIDAASAEVRRRQLFIAGDAARHFGRVSGERSLLPVPRLALPLLRRQCPVVQAQYLRNLVVRELAEWGIDQDSLQITFTAQVRPGQTLCLLLQDTRFELLSQGGRLVAFGKVA